MMNIKILGLEFFFSSLNVPLTSHGLLSITSITPRFTSFASSMVFFFFFFFLTPSPSIVKLFQTGSSVLSLTQTVKNDDYIILYNTVYNIYCTINKNVLFSQTRTTETSSNNSYNPSCAKPVVLSSIIANPRSNHRT